jgi:hypothetical protein
MIHLVQQDNGVRMRSNARNKRVTARVTEEAKPILHLVTPDNLEFDSKGPEEETPFGMKRHQVTIGEDTGYYYPDTKLIAWTYLAPNSPRRKVD